MGGIVGGDSQKQNLMSQLQKLIRDLGVEGSVLLAGEQIDVDKYYCASEVFAFSSSSEEFPNVIGEAMAAGLPVVSFDCVAGPSEMIRHGENGFPVPVHDYAGFKKTLEYLIDHENVDKEMGERAKISIQRFSIDFVGEKLLAFLAKGRLGCLQRPHHEACESCLI